MKENEDRRPETEESSFNEWYVKPQDRPIEGTIEFDKDGEKVKEPKAYSVPHPPCEGCPVYRVDERVKPTAYYCQADFLFGAFAKAMKENKVPKGCRIPQVINYLKNRR